MAEALEPIKISLQNEGGYNLKPSSGSGETYMGIDRKQGKNGNWPGW